MRRLILLTVVALLALAPVARAACVDDALVKQLPDTLGDTPEAKVQTLVKRQLAAQARAEANKAWAQCKQTKDPQACAKVQAEARKK